MSLALKFDPKTIEHLGVKMYATLPPALAELISNAYDADASKVSIQFLEQNGTPVAITIEDNGFGMSLSDIRNKFLVIGRNRRKDLGDQPSSTFKRLPTGKKGLGKLALFGLAKEITVDTIKDGRRNRFKLNWDNLLASSDTYSPEIEINDEVVIGKAAKTNIQLSALKRKSSFDLDALADSLSRIFVVENDFQIELNDGREKTILVSNERRYGSIEKQFEWTESDIVNVGDAYFGKISLSLLTAKTPIPPSSGLRGIALFSRGKLVNAPEYFSESTSSHFYQYLTGWIKADFIDLIEEDVISTNRQALNWEHPEMADFRQYLEQLISTVGQDWRKKRANKKEKEVETITGIDTQSWFRSLPEGVRESVESIVQEMTRNEEVNETTAPVVRALYKLIPEYPLLHWRYLHKSIKDGVYEYYKNDQFGHAADQGAKLFADRIRTLTNQVNLDGTDLASVFSIPNTKEANGVATSPKLPVNDLSTLSLRNIQEGQGHLTRGLMAGFRNPINHAPMARVVPNLISELDCLNILSLISYLSEKLDYYENKLIAAQAN
jgi:uncharacterized protein (TIGR02391 family)